MTDHLYDAPPWEFWTTERHRWPRRDGWVFLADAVIRFGSVMFPNEWRDVDPLIKPWDASIDPRRKDEETLGYAVWFVHCRIAVERVLGKAEAAKALSPSGRALAHRRFMDVMNKIAELAAVQKLITGARPREGGEITKMEQPIWSTETLQPRFTVCQLYLPDPYADRIAGPGYSYIFVSKKSLDQALSPTASIRRVATTSKAEIKCQKWLEAEMLRSPLKRPQPRVEFWREAISKFGDRLSRRGFDRAWNTAAGVTGAQAWLAAGRPKKSPQEIPAPQKS
jgi:hypothetical protein